MDSGRGPGGIYRVLELTEKHYAAFVYDFRSRFGVGVEDLGTKIPWSEVIVLTDVLLRDPSSWLTASVNKWRHPITYDWAVLASLYDLLAQVNSKRKPKPFPRPWSGGQKTGKVRRDARSILKKAKDGDFKWQNKPTPM